MSIPIKKREQKEKAVIINEDTAHAADRNGNGDAKVAQRGLEIGEIGNRPTPNRELKTRVGKRRGREGTRGEETTTMTSIDEGIKRNNVRDDE